MKPIGAGSQMSPSTDGIEIQVMYRCEGCGAFLTADEIVNGDGHRTVEYLEGRPIAESLCGPVGKEAWHD